MVFLVLAAKAASLLIFLFQGLMVHLGSKFVLLFFLITRRDSSSLKYHAEMWKKISKGDENMANCSHNVTDSIIFTSL